MLNCPNCKATHILLKTEKPISQVNKTIDADKRVREVLRLRGIRCVIPFKKNRLNLSEYDKGLHKERLLIENFFCKLKNTEG